MAIYSNKLITIQEQLHELATTDPLTGLLNRRAFAHRYDRESARYSRTNRPIALLLIDLDYFKLINDRYGHAAGDAALRVLSDHLRTTSRFGTDDVARWGGEEFIILLPETDAKGAAVLGEKLREAVADNRFEYEGNRLGITMTFGIAEHRKGEPLETCIARADTALYHGKERGRNKVMVGKYRGLTLVN